jgi:hypothetical protein
VPTPACKSKHFEDASGHFQDGYHQALQGTAFTKIIDMLKDKPGQVMSNAHDFAQLVVLLQGAAENRYFWCTSTWAAECGSASAASYA